MRKEPQNPLQTTPTEAITETLTDPVEFDAAEEPEVIPYRPVGIDPTPATSSSATSSPSATRQPDVVSFSPTFASEPAAPSAGGTNFFPATAPDIVAAPFIHPDNTRFEGIGAQVGMDGGVSFNPPAFNIQVPTPAEIAEAERILRLQHEVARKKNEEKGQFMFQQYVQDTKEGWLVEQKLPVYIFQNPRHQKQLGSFTGSINGAKFAIPRGKQVLVPRSIYELLVACGETAALTAEDERRLAPQTSKIMNALYGETPYAPKTPGEMVVTNNGLYTY